MTKEEIIEAIGKPFPTFDEYRKFAGAKAKEEMRYSFDGFGCISCIKVPTPFGKHLQFCDYQFPEGKNWIYQAADEYKKELQKEWENEIPHYPTDPYELMIGANVLE